MSRTNSKQAKPALTGGVLPPSEAAPETVREGDVYVKSYMSAGLVIESDFDLPGLSVTALGTGSPQLRFLRASAPPNPPPASTPGGINWSNDPHNVQFTAHDVAVFDIASNGTVSVWPLTDRLDDIASYLVGSVLGIALHLRKIVTLHASAVEVDNGAVLFCGHSGAGKSTMAAALQQRGYALLSDDLCAIELTEDGVIAHSDGRKLKLWDQAITEFGLEDEKEQPVRHGFEKYFVDAGLGARRSAAVRALFVLARSTSISAPRIVTVPLAEAAALIRDNAYRPFLVHELKDEALYFKAAAALLRQSGVLRLERAHDFEQLDLVTGMLKRRW